MNHVEWAVIQRLGSMLNRPPGAEFDVTLSFALFSSIIAWVIQRVRVGNDEGGDTDQSIAMNKAARAMKAELSNTLIIDQPWHLQAVMRHPLVEVNANFELQHKSTKTNLGFTGMKALDFFIWLRDALAHGDARVVSPISQDDRDGGKSLIGFKIEVGEKPLPKNGLKKRRLYLYHADMKRLGVSLAAMFCRYLGGKESEFERLASTVRIPVQALAG